MQHVEVEHVLDADEALRRRLLDHAQRLRRLAIDGAHPAAEAADEHPPTQVIEVPEGQRVDPDTH